MDGLPEPASASHRSDIGIARTRDEVPPHRHMRWREPASAPGRNVHGLCERASGSRRVHASGRDHPRARRAAPMIELRESVSALRRIHPWGGDNPTTHPAAPTVGLRGTRERVPPNPRPGGAEPVSAFRHTHVCACIRPRVRPVAPTFGWRETRGRVPTNPRPGCADPRPRPAAPTFGFPRPAGASRPTEARIRDRAKRMTVRRLRPRNVRRSLGCTLGDTPALCASAPPAMSFFFRACVLQDIDTGSRRGPGRYPINAWRNS